MLYKVIHRTGCILVNTSPHQLHWGDWEMGWLGDGVTRRWGDWEMGWLGDGDCYLEHRMQLNGWYCSKVGRDSWKHCLFVQLFFVKLSFIWKLYKQSYPHVQLVVHVWTINKSHHHKNCQPKRYPKSPTVHDVLQPIPIIFYGTSSHQLHSGEEGLLLMSCSWMTLVNKYNCLTYETAVYSSLQWTAVVAIFYRHKPYNGNIRGRKLSQIPWFCGYLQKFSSQNLGAWQTLAQQKRAILSNFSPWKFPRKFPAIRYYLTWLGTRTSYSYFSDFRLNFS